jgi:hypothetical protein
VPAEGKNSVSGYHQPGRGLKNTLLRYFAAKARTRHVMGRVRGCSCQAQTPIGICSAERVTARGAVISFHFDKAWFTAGKGRRLMNLPRPGCGMEFCPSDQTMSPRESV